MSGKNVVVLILDTARYKSIAGENYISSKYNFSTGSAYADAPWTLPSHASIFTGTTPLKHGAHADHKHLNDALTTLPEILHANGYETVAISNNTWISDEFGFDQGFENFYKTWQYIQSDTDLGQIAREKEGIDKLQKAARALFDGNPVANLTNAIYGRFFRKTEDDGAARTNEWIDNWLEGRDDSRPFFLFVNYIEPHLEYHPPKVHAKKHLPESITYEQAMEIPQDAWSFIADETEISEEDFEILRALYRAEISYIEEKVEEVIKLLKTAGKWENTLFIITSDHGENIGEHGLMDHQYALYDTLLHVPLFVHGGPFEDETIDDIIQLLDIPPTILDTLDIDAPSAREQFQGISFHPDSERTREHATAEYIAPQPSMAALERRVGRLPEHVQKYDRSLRTIRTDQYKYIRGSDGTQELYDILNDPGETNDIVDARADIVATLDAKLDDWLDSFEPASYTGEVSMNDDTRARLEDLGYLQ